MRQNGLGTLTLDEARTWIEETGLCLFLPRRQFSSAVAPSFVEAVAGRPEVTPDQKTIAIAEDLLIHLENEGVAVRLNLQGQPGEQPDFVVAAWVLPYVYALRGDRDWRRSPQLTGSRQVSQLAVHVYKQLEGGDENVSRLKQALGREVSESAVVRAITELWQQLRIIPVIAARGQAAKWQLLRTRFQRAIAEGASTSQVTAISVLASIYLQAVIAASMEDVELFLAALTARSKIREVIRGLVATRQVHTISLGHAPHFYVAGTLPEFEPISTMYASSSMPASSYFLRSFERDEEAHGPAISLQRPAPQPMPISQPPAPPVHIEQHPIQAENHVPRTPVRRPSANGSSNGSTNGTSSAARPHFNRTSSNGHDRKSASTNRPASSASSSRPARRGPDARPSSSRTQSSTRSSAGTRWGAGKNGKSNGTHAPSRNGNGTHAPSRNGNGTHAPSRNGNGNGNGTRATASSSRVSNGNGAHRNGKSTAPSWSKRTGNAKTVKPIAKSSSARKEVRPVRKSRPTLAAAGRSGASGKRFFNSRSKQGTKKRG
jgi:23S rRNA pseudouridine2605 synthase